MKQPRIHGRFASSRQAAEYRRKFEALHGQLRAELNPGVMDARGFPIAGYVVALFAVALVAMVAA